MLRTLRQGVNEKVAVYGAKLLMNCKTGIVTLGTKASTLRTRPRVCECIC